MLTYTKDLQIVQTVLIRHSHICTLTYTFTHRPNLYTITGVSIWAHYNYHIFQSLRSTNRNLKMPMHSLILGLKLS